MKTYRFLKQKAAKQNIAPKKVATERSCKKVQTNKNDSLWTSKHYFYGNITRTANNLSILSKFYSREIKARHNMAQEPEKL